MRVIGYLRVSTEKQVKDGYGLVDQEKQIRKWCREHGHKLVALIRDDAKSGTLPAHERPGLLDCLRAIKAGNAEGIVMRDLDRIARVLTTQEAILAEVWKLGGEVFISTDANPIPKDDPDDPMRTAMRQMMGVFAQLERAMVVKRMANGKQAKRDAGGYAGDGSPAFGYRAENRELAPDDREQAGIARIVALADAGKSLREIISQLEAEDIAPKRGGSWHPTTVKRIIERAKGH